MNCAAHIHWTKRLTEEMLIIWFILSVSNYISGQGIICDASIDLTKMNVLRFVEYFLIREDVQLSMLRHTTRETYSTLHWSCNEILNISCLSAFFKLLKNIENHLMQRWIQWRKYALHRHSNGGHQIFKSHADPFIPIASLSYVVIKSCGTRC